MFESARIKITAWYMLIIMAVSVGFSAVIYRETIQEVERGIRSQQYRWFRSIFPDMIPPRILNSLDEDLMRDVRNRIILSLTFINLGIVLISGAAGYILAGQTLKSIQLMMDEQDRFISDVSHEFRTPLTAIRAEIEVFNRNKKKRLSDAVRILNSNLEEVSSLQSISETLLKLTSYQQLNNTLSFEEISLSEIIAEARKKIIPSALRKNIDIKVRDSVDCFFRGNRPGLVELLIILLDNAVKYSQNNSEVTIQTRLSDHTIEIDIIDRGLGIKSQDIPHIFDRFYRADLSRTKTDAGGYGLGLSIAKKIATAHNGIIRVKSSVGNGSIFSLHLPQKLHQSK